MTVEQCDVAGVVNGLATAVRATVDRLVTDMELELGRGTVRSAVGEQAGWRSGLRFIVSADPWPQRDLSVYGHVVETIFIAVTLIV